MPGISGPKFINGEWVMVITRLNGTEYRVRNTDRQSAFDYLTEFIQHQQQRRR